ncbi:MAG TPA: beta-galactosidase [Ktedonobacteraceae bacterium]|nr:beta-galactosidase [Ktedonobacteraceae bacterium]
MPYPFPTKILYGADYNPEQWPGDIWLDDMRLMKLAHINMVSINIFSWASLEPAPHTYHFEQLDRIMDLLAEHDIAADLATATASPPTWMSRHYPDLLPVTREGVRLVHGSRRHYCPNSLDYRRESAELVQRLAERYVNHPTLKLWHVDNEYGCHISSACYCDRCASAFRQWLRERYGSLEALNEAWATGFWSQHYYSWEDVLPPRPTPGQPNPGQFLDYQRFMSDSFLECYLIQARILREITPEVPVTTNFMSAYQPLDYFAWAPHVDIISNDSYPPNSAPVWETALVDDLMRSLKGGKPYILMEQSPSQVNWMPQNPQKRPGRMRMLSYQNVAHGADGLMFFQWRQSQAGAEMFHSAVVTHEGSEHTRIFRQAAQLGGELEQLAPHVVGSRVPAQVALLMDWQNWWAVEYMPGPSNRLHYWEQIKTYYEPLHRLKVAVDIVQPTGDLSNYRLVIAPLLYMLRPGVAQNLEQFVRRGGILLTTFFSGIVNQDNHVTLGGYPGELRKLLGIHIEEFDPWTEAMTNQVVIGEGPLQGIYRCTLWGELIHLEGAQAIGTFAHDYYAGGPALTRHQFGRGEAYYLATQVGEGLLDKLIQQLCRQADVAPVLAAPAGVEVTRRVQADGRAVYFLLNHTDRPEVVILPEGTFTALLTGKEVEAEVEVAGQDVVVLVSGDDV